MESNAFGSSHLPSQALVVLSEAASGLHEALRGQRPFPTRLPDAKDLHNMSLVGSYGTHLLHSFHPHLLQSLNHGMLANGGPASYFASDRGGLGKPSVLSNFQLPSAFSPPKYIGISLDQNLFNGSESFRTDSASPTCTSHESMEGSNDYDPDKGESPRSNNSDPRDLRHVHSKPAATSSATTTATTTTGHHLHHQHHQQQQQQQQPPLHQHPHLHPHHPLPNGTLVSSGSLTTGVAAGGPVMSIVGCPGMRAGIGAIGGLSVGAGPGTGAGAGHVPDGCPVCGLKLTAEEWNSHFLTELDRLYKLSAGMERPSLQASYMFAPPCPAQENAIRTSHNRWETFQRIRNNRQNRLRVKVRKRKFGSEMYFLDNLFCSSCPICKRKYALETTGKPPEDDPKALEEIETVDVESCNDDVPDSGSELHNQNSTSGSASGSSSVGSVSGSNMHSSNNQPGKLDGILYRTACVINKEGGEEDLVSTNSGIGGAGPAPWESHLHPATTTTTSAHPPGPTTTQGHITVKAVSELSSTTHHFYSADSCGEERLGGKDAAGDVDREGDGDGDADADVSMCNNDSDEDVIVDDDDSIKMSLGRKRKYEETVVSSRSSDNLSPPEERPRSEPQVTSTEPGMEMPHNNNNSIANNNKYHVFEELRTKQHLELQQHHHQQQQQQQQQQHLQQTLRQEADNGPGLTQLDSKVGICSENKPDEEYKCFICKTGIKDFSSDFFRGRNLYFHQSCANVMSSYRLSKDLQQQQQSLIQQQQQQQQQESRKSPPSSGAN